MSDGKKAGWELWERSSYLYFLVSLSTPNASMERGCDLISTKGIVRNQVKAVLAGEALQ